MTQTMQAGAAGESNGAHAWKLVSALLVWATIAYVCIFIALDYKSVFHSDAAIKSVLADLASRQGHLIPTQWVFANGDTLTMTPYLFILPFAGMTGISYTSNMLAVIAGYLSLVGAAWFCARQVLGQQQQARTAAVALIASTLSAASLEFIASQGAYSIYSAVALGMFALLASRSRGRFVAMAMFVLAFLLASTNPKRAFVMAFAPCLMALAAAALHSRRERMQNLLSSFRDVTVVSMVAGAVAGAAIYYLAIVPNIANYDAAASIKLAPPRVMAHSMLQIPVDWFRYFLINRPWAELSGPTKILQLGVWLIVVLILIAPGWIILKGSENPRLKYFAWLCYALLAAGILPLIVTQGIYWSALELRYSTLGVLVGFIVLAGAISELGARAKIRPRYMLMAMSVVAVTTAAMWPSLYKPENADAHGVSLRDRERLIELLESEHVGTAVGTYWNSHVISVLSEGKVRVYPVTYSERMAPFVHHVPFEPTHGEAGRRHAVILSKAEFASDGGRALERQLGKPSERIDSGPFVVSIYESPISDAVYGVGARFDEPVNKATVAIDTGTGLVPACEARDKCSMQLRVVNTGKTTLASNGQAPMRIGIQGMNAKGELVAADIGRIEFPTPLAPGKAISVQATLGKLPSEVVSLHACLVQENVAWLCDRTTATHKQPPGIDSPIDAANLGIELSQSTIASCPASDPDCSVMVHMTNIGRYPLTTSGAVPLRLGMRIGEPGAAGTSDIARIDLGRDLGPGESMQIEIKPPPAAAAEKVDYRLCLVQELVAWHCDKTFDRSERK